MVKSFRFGEADGSGIKTPARFALMLLLAFASSPALAQSGGGGGSTAGLPPPSSVPVPDTLEVNKLVWSTMAAVDHANQAGNYSVLRDLSAPGFQIMNDAAKLTEIFASLRQSRIDLSNTLLLAPTYTSPPSVPEAGVLHLRGYFALRPTAIAFDLYYQWNQGKWKLFGVNIQPSTLATTPPVAAQPQPGRRGN